MLAGLFPWVGFFCRRHVLASAGVSVPSHFLCLSAAVRQDLSIQEVVLDQFNGRSLLLQGPTSNADLELYINASGLIRFGAYFQGAWCAERWPDSWVSKGYCTNLVLLELFPILVALDVWGDRLRDKRIGLCVII